MYRHVFFLKLKSSRLRFCNKKKRFFGHFQVVSTLKLKDYDTVEEFFIHYEKAVNKLKSAGGNIDESEKMRYLLKTLPPNYSYIGDFTYVIPEKRRIVDYVKSKIKEKNRNKNQNEMKNVRTFNAITNKECFVCMLCHVFEIALYSNKF